MNEDVLLGTNEYPLLVDLIATVEGFIDVEDARVLAEQGRVAAENIRNENEDIRNQNELERVSDEAKRDEAEAVRVSNENTRITNENARKSAETSRVNAEGERVTAENKRATAETARETAEKSRANAETARVNAETLRANAETQRALEFAKWLAANAVANTLPAGSEATAEIIEVNGAKRFVLGIPKGADGSGTGDMSKSTYDKDNDGVIDKAADADKLGGKEASEYQAAIKITAATLFITEWAGAAAPYTYNLNVDGVTASSIGGLRIAQTATDEQFAAWGAAQPRITAQSANNITVSIMGDVPAVNIPVEVWYT